jgi:ribosomal RNA methyltransferase Nop2
MVRTTLLGVISKPGFSDVLTGYSEFLADKLLNLFPPREAQAFFEANETPRPIVIRTNTLRTHRRELAQSLINRGVQLEPVGKWVRVPNFTKSVA